MSPKYRPDIDGLRAIAVLSVILFHMDIAVFSGGYVGVDVFFVISGYLITTIIYREVDTGSFKFSTFYERRFRRILPALLVVVSVSLILGSIMLMPKSFIELGNTSAATALFASNIVFYFHSGYFAAPAELQPLLHTWSLAIEEQFYIFFPIILVVINKLSKKLIIPVLLLIFLASLLYSQRLTAINPDAAFYLIQSRAWELLIGSIVALNILPTIRQSYPQRSCYFAGANINLYQHLYLYE